jgi:hypothetical protein
MPAVTCYMNDTINLANEIPTLFQMYLHQIKARSHTNHIKGWTIDDFKFVMIFYTQMLCASKFKYVMTFISLSTQFTYSIQHHQVGIYCYLLSHVYLCEFTDLDQPVSILLFYCKEKNEGLTKSSFRQLMIM